MPGVSAGAGPTLDQLGPRLCIMGPSNSGKSTLAEAIGRARGMPVVYLDQLHHLPDTDWTPRPHEEFAGLHDAAIAGERWVIEGNYSRVLPARLARATGVILLDVHRTTSLWRYVHRTLFDRDRPGTLDGAPERITWRMVHHIAIVQPGNRARYGALFDTLTLPKLRLASPAAVAEFYRAEGLSRADVTTAS